MESVIQALSLRATMHPDRDALVTGDQRVSYGELWIRIVAAAHELARCGVGQDDRVILAAPSVPAFVYGYFATHLVGATAVVLDPDAPAPRREELFRRARPKIAFGTNAEPDSELGRIRAIDELESLPGSVRTVLVPEMNLGQMSREAERYTEKKVECLSKIGGVTHTTREILSKLREVA